MKIWCNSCESAEAVVMCCADDAALCRRCDEKIHAANKVASKHQRTSLSYCPKLPACDICQDAIGYFFCVEDRALLCSKCDVAIHTANAYVGGHQRFLITGVRVGTDPSPTLPSTVGAVDRVPSATTPSKNSATVIPKKLLPSAPPPPLPPSMAPPVAPAAVNIFSGQPCVRDDIGLPNRFQFNAGPLITGSLPNWGFDDFMSLPDFDQNFAMLDNGSSKVRHLCTNSTVYNGYSFSPKGTYCAHAPEARKADGRVESQRVIVLSVLDGHGLRPELVRLYKHPPDSTRFRPQH